VQINQAWGQLHYMYYCRFVYFVMVLHAEVSVIDYIWSHYWYFH